MKLWIFALLSMMISEKTHAECSQFGFQDYPQAYMFYCPYTKPIKTDDSTILASYMLSFVQAQSVPVGDRQHVYRSAIYHFDIDCINEKFIPSSIDYYSFDNGGGEVTHTGVHLPRQPRKWVSREKGTRMDYIMRQACQ